MEFRDLKRQYQHLKPQIDSNIADVISDGRFISGPQVSIIEEKLAEYVSVRHCISCGNGTDAISIALMAYGIGAGDAVFVPDFTFFASGECPAAAGAVPIFVDVNMDTFNIDACSLEMAAEKIITEGKLKAKAVIAADLFGLPADYHAIRQVCKKYDLILLEDGAQGFGGKINGQRACSFGDISTTSFFPAKPLGCYGDGGAIFTNDDKIADICRSIAVHGKKAGNKYDNVRLGMNSRLDTLQAAVLIPKLQAFEEYELENVNKAAAMYTEILNDTDRLILPAAENGFYSSWAQYTVRLSGGVSRAFIQERLKSAGIPTMIYYAKPMHRQKAFENTRSSAAECRNTSKLCESVLCLPMHPYLKESEICFVAENLKEALLLAERDKNGF